MKVLIILCLIRMIEYNLHVLLWNILGIGAKYHFREVTNMMNFTKLLCFDITDI